MPSRALVTVTALVLAALAALFLFAPAELLAQLGVLGAAPAQILLQLAGAALLALAAFNWSSRREMACGAPSCTLPQTNFVHFTAGALILAKPVLRTPSPQLGIALALYTVFALAYAWVLWGPRRGSSV